MQRADNNTQTYISHHFQNFPDIQNILDIHSI